MSFVAISTNNPLGQRPLNLMARHQGMGWFADVPNLGAAPTPGDYDTNQQVLGQLVAMGAITQQDATDIWNGDASLDDMAVNMTMINQALQFSGQAAAQTVAPLPADTHTVAQVIPYKPAPPTPAPGSTSAAQIPTGSVISWTVSYSVAVVGVNGGPPPSSFIASFQSALSQFGYTFIGAKILQSPLTGVLGGAAQIQFQILDNVGNALATDAQANLTALANKLTGNSVVASSIPQVIALATSGGTPQNPAGAPASITSFLEGNVGLLAAVAIAIVVLPPLIKKL